MIVSAGGEYLDYQSMLLVARMKVGHGAKLIL
jgi:hypothetical protein